MNRLYYSEEQDYDFTHNYVMVNGEWKPYSEWCSNDDTSNWDDAILVYESEEEPNIKYGENKPFDEMEWD